ncbi:MAG: YbhB/YbcL family Raf kinase inhibitor-like protein [Bacteroidetes bacterium]|nr:YbhB/YbcL family Raf kinase inhibitor-like protein [Bacteroidota bacterium]
MRTVYTLIFLAMATALTSLTDKAQLTITSSSFSNNGMIPKKYTCQGDQVNPPLHISGIPSGAKSLALILHDPDAQHPGGFTHWVMWNLPTDGRIAENFKGGTQGLNGAGKTGYIGMCPPSGVHHYHFMVYALDKLLTLDKNTDKAGLEKAMAGHIVAQGDLVGLYEKTK